MHLVLIGDVGWRNFYHLGDEAMTEHAIDAARARGVERITLIAGDPEHAAEMYGVESIPRIGFTMERRSRNAKRQAAVMSHLTGGSTLPEGDSARAVIEAVRQADGVVICGGGNLNSMFDHHLYERSTLARIAQHVGTPYALSSQTLGPLVIDADRPLMAEIVQGAAVFGARESHTLGLAREISGPGATVSQQIDDAFSLSATEEDRAAVADLTTEPFVLMSFAEKPSSPVIDGASYREMVARVAREVTERTGRAVLLVPHAGAFAGQEPKRDQITDAEIVALAARPAVRATRTLTARELVALTEAAELVIGSRYHAAIFAARAATPYISAPPNLYSSVRMRGAARNVGVEQYVLPFDHDPGAVIETAVSLLTDESHRTAAVEHLRSAAELRATEHERWWDALVHRFRSGDPMDVSFAEVPVLENPAVPAEHSHALLDAIERYGHAQALASREAAQELHQVRADLRRAKKRAERAETAARHAEDQLAARLSMRLGRKARQLARRATRRG